VDIFNLLGGHCNSATINCLAALRRSREFDRELHFFHGCLPLFVYLELDLPRSYGEGIPASLGRVPLWRLADTPLCRLFLLLFLGKEGRRQAQTSQLEEGYANCSEG